MPNRCEVLEQYVVDKGIIRSPGKYEGEPIWVPYLWELDEEDEVDFLNGKQSRLFKIKVLDGCVFPELYWFWGAWIRLYEDENGFIKHEVEYA